jgi:Flp pilus assembly pilin Flp
MELVNRLRSFVRHEEGQDLLEYALLVALIALVAYAGVQLAGQSVAQIFNTIAGSLSAVA